MVVERCWCFSLFLLVFSGLVLEVVDGLPEERHAEQAALVVFKQQPVGAAQRHTQTHTQHEH